ncbi:MAG: peptidoglycan endopeptidase, partial [Ignavibacteria bacterium]
FEVLNEIDKGSYKILKVKTDDYIYNTDLYIDSRFVELKKEKPIQEKKKLPAKEIIYEFLYKAVGAKYCWGGNYINGINKMLELYRPTGSISEETEYLWTLKGCDCSGLMYEATKGYTERNTSKLLYFGEPLEIEGLTANQIAAKLKPLDMIVWEGHTIYVYDENTAIQSSLSAGGVVKTDLIETIKDVMKTRKPVNDYDRSKRKRFVVRRWHDRN